MASNKFFTIMIVPEKSDKVTKIVIPGWVFRTGILSAVFVLVLATIMVLDYANVMNQINENKKLRIENRQLHQNVQIFKNKIVSIENTMDRVKTFVTKLRIITNIDESGSPLSASNTPITLPIQATQTSGQPLNWQVGPPVPLNGTETGESEKPVKKRQKKKVQATEILPDSSAPQPTNTQPNPITPPANAAPDASAPNSNTMNDEQQTPYEMQRGKRLNLLAALMTESPEGLSITDADTSLWVKAEFEKLDAAYEDVNAFTLLIEQETQDLLDKLGDKRALIASTPTRIPTLGGYITSDYGVRISPYDNRRKLHEGIDIANRYGADIISPADGVISFAGVKPGYGKVVIIDHLNGIETLYGHSSKLYVAVGAKIKRGQKIAAVGNTGHSTGPHVHYEVRAHGLTVDPCGFILDSICARTTKRAIRISGKSEDPSAVDMD